MISKMKHTEGGSRLAIVFNASPMFTGGAGSGESNIRKWIIENDWLEAVIALPDQLFYNTGIFTYIWVLSTRKAKERKGKIQLINATGFVEKMPKSLGNKRNRISESQIGEITRIYGDFRAGEFCKIVDNDDFGYRRVTVERPLRMKFQITPERVKALKDRGNCAYITLEKLVSSKVYNDRNEFMVLVLMKNFWPGYVKRLKPMKRVGEYGRTDRGIERTIGNLLRKESAGGIAEVFLNDLLRLVVNLLWLARRCSCAARHHSPFRAPLQQEFRQPRELLRFPERRCKIRIDEIQNAFAVTQYDLFAAEHIVQRHFFFLRRGQIDSLLGR